MKTGALTTFLALCLPVTVFATTLRLSNEVDLLVLDGKKVSSSLLRGAESIELENGRINSFSGWKKPSACPVMKSGFIFLRRW
ncbi:UPF0319 protein YccT precursor [Salmonella enterica subsp. enterica]|uniref:UPF0319 protein YccT n=1 Tax=Salmonella enterica I TaxID=59201 RepID=A0A379WXA5_SALET|nr:UPF0319 protein YccT precursor [Salmonella enterica subsp. enterica]